jgi:hypothetical protein
MSEEMRGLTASMMGWSGTVLWDGTEMGIMAGQERGALNGAREALGYAANRQINETIPFGTVLGGQLRSSIWSPEYHEMLEGMDAMRKVEKMRSQINRGGMNRQDEGVPLEGGLPAVLDPARQMMVEQVYATYKPALEQYKQLDGNIQDQLVSIMSDPNRTYRTKQEAHNRMTLQRRELAKTYLAEIDSINDEMAEYFGTNDFSIESFVSNGFVPPTDQ